MTNAGWWLTICVTAFTDFIISGGGALLAAMTVNQTVGLPDQAAILVSCLTGLIASARSIQKLTSTPPVVTKP